MQALAQERITRNKRKLVWTREKVERDPPLRLDDDEITS